MKTQSLWFKLYLLKEGEEEYVEGQWVAEQDSACRWGNNEIQYHKPGQEGL